MKQNTVNAIYLHGFASAFDPNNAKVEFLKTQVNLIPFSYDTCASYDENLQKMTAVIHQHDITLLVGCSLGGFYALELAEKIAGTFALALNPSYNPKQSLASVVGSHINYTTNCPETLSQSVVESYPTGGAPRPCNAIIMVELGDTVVDPRQSEYHFLKAPSGLKFLSFPGGNHRFESLPSRWHLVEPYLKPSPQLAVG